MEIPAFKINISTKIKYLCGLLCLLLALLLCFAFRSTGADDFDLARQEIALRNIGHEVLLHSGDSTSRVLPVKKPGDNEYQISFENEFTFQPDSLKAIVSRSLAKDQLAKNYVVNVMSCSGASVIFGYAISENENNNIVPCSGRKQVKNCYVIDLKFQQSDMSYWQKGSLIGGLCLLIPIGLLASSTSKNRKNKVESSPVEVDDPIKIGNTLFDPKKQQIITAGLATELTAKENKLLLIFAHSPNALIERSRLQKEIWEDEGVIVSRSLDMFISKLRKKLENDLTIQLTNIHGKGYKLEIGN